MPRTYLEGFAVFGAGAADDLVFLERQRQRLLAENVLSRHERFDRDFDVPVVRSDDGNCVDVVAFQDPAVVLVRVRLNNLAVRVTLADAGIDGTGDAVVFVNVANRHDVSEAVKAVGVAQAHAPDADAAQADPVAWSLRPNRFRGISHGNRRRHCGQSG